MRNHIFLSIIALFLMASCSTDHGEPLTTLRVINENTLKTKSGVYLQLSFVKDSIKLNDVDPSIADAISTFKNNGTPLERVGHCWSKSSPNPTLADSSSSFRNIEITEELSIKSRLTKLHYLSEYYVRAYVITESGDTAYSPSTLKFATKHLADSWSARNDFIRGGRRYGVSFTIGNLAYFGTGEGKSSEGTGYFKDFYEYNPTSDTWTQKADVGKDDGNEYERIHAVGIGNGEYGYIGTGEKNDGELLQDFWKYNPKINKWTSIQTGQENHGFYTPRSKAIGFAVNGKIYVGLGEYGEGSTKTAHDDIYELNENETAWISKEKFGGGPRINATVFVSNATAYVYGGTTNDGVIKNDLFEFAPVGGGLGAWYSKANMPDEGRKHPVSFAIEGSGYICLGQKADGTIVRDNWKYKTATDQWEKQKDFGFDGREGAIGFAIGVKGFVGFGHDGNNYVKDFWEYLPDEPNLGVEE